MAIEEGLKVAFSPVQLAAVMSNKSVTEGETLSNRLFGGLGLAGGVVELMGAGVMCYAPDPTFLTKVGCVIVGTHSLDSIKAASNQIITGQPTTTDTYQSAVSLARSLGADEETAYNVGLTVDIAVPLVFAVAIGAARVASVRVGRVRLIEHESMTGIKPGGHTIAQHVAKSQDELAQRLAKNPTMRAATSFTNMRIAEEAISEAVKHNQEWIKVWAGSSTRPASPLVANYSAGRVIGYGLLRGEQTTTKLSNLRVVIRFEVFHGKPYYILTAYPTT
ncbi:hypothetical protein SAMN02744783_04777 [Serratia sp. CC22-02]|uniref:RNase A-like domain-containing protein n=1 Tax=Serratia sp. CC22-02 TaxID=1378076 RepID=UPI002402EDAA|nr:RNase A-like domain-containing protein [Serratia sp. CC22-02]SMP80990.1 hypothetical protein SAMN02744783_04777 [Serratia sp. CC22-02]